MTDTPHETELLGTRREAWFAWAIGLPIYAGFALMTSLPAITTYASIIGEPSDSDNVIAAGLVVALLDVMIAIFGLGLVTHTLGHALNNRILEWPTLRASGAFALLALVLSIIPISFLAVGTKDIVGGMALGFIAVAIPSALTSGITRFVLPTVLQNPVLSRVVVGVAIFAAVVIVLWLVLLLRP